MTERYEGGGMGRETWASESGVSDACQSFGVSGDLINAEFYPFFLSMQTVRNKAFRAILAPPLRRTRRVAKVIVHRNLMYVDS